MSISVNEHVEVMQKLIKEKEALMEEYGASYVWETKDARDPETNELILDAAGNPTKVRVLTITSVSDTTQRAMGFFLDTVPSFFPGCDELRVQYKEELAAAKNAGCTGCQEAALKRKYIRIVLDHLKEYEKHGVRRATESKYEEKPVYHYIPDALKKQFNVDETDPNTRVRKVSDPVSSSKPRVEAERSVLRKATSYIAKIFGFGKREKEG